MKKLVYIFLFFAFVINGFAQGDTTKKVVEIMPEFPGGANAMMKFIQKSIHYPKDALENAWYGRIYSCFTVTSEGKLQNISIINNCKYKSVNDEVLRVISIMPNWKCGTVNGEPEDVFFMLPISFSIGHSLPEIDSSELVNNPHFKKAKADFFYNAGVKKSEEKKYKDAADSFENCLKISVEDIDALYNLGAVYINLNQTNKACESWKKIKALGKNDADELIKQYCAN